MKIQDHRTRQDNRLRYVSNFIYERRWLVLTLASPFLFFPTPTTAIVMVIVPALFIFSWWSGNQPLPRTPFNPIILWLMLTTLVGILFSYDMTVSLPKLAGIILGLGVFFLFASYGSHERAWIICLAVFWATGVGIALTGLLGTQWALKFEFLNNLNYRFEPKITGLPGTSNGINPNELAGALLWVLPVMWIVLGIGWQRMHQSAGKPPTWLKPLWVVVLEATGFVSLVMLISQSRSGYLGLALLGVTFALCLFRRRPVWIASTILLIMILIGAIAWWYETDPAFRKAVGAPTENSALFSMDTLDGRDLVWARAILGIEKYPLTGMGLNAFRYLVNTLDPLHPIYADRDIAHAHNEFLQAALDLGIPGLLAFIGIYLVAFGMLYRIWGRAQSDANSSAPPGLFSQARSVRWLVLGLGGGLYAHLWFGLTDVVALGAKPGVLFWMLLGLIAGMYQRVVVSAR